MLALYRSGRQANALKVYRQTRCALADDLGLDPGEELPKRLHHAILDHDPRLDLAAAQTGAVAGAVEETAANGGALDVRTSSPATSDAGRTRPALFHRRDDWARCGRSRGGRRVHPARATAGDAMTAAPNWVAVIDPRADRVVAQTPVGAVPGSITAGVGGVWVANTEDHSISNINPASRSVVRTLSFGSVDGVAADSTALWIVDSTREVVARINPTFKTVVKTVGLGDNPAVGTSPDALAVGDGVAWVANRRLRGSTDRPGWREGLAYRRWQ